MDTNYFRKFLGIFLLAGLLILSFLVLKPILLYVVLGFILAFVFNPLHNFVMKITKSPTFSATLISILLILIVLLPIWFFTPMIIDQVFKLFLAAQVTDFVGILQNIFPSFFASEQFSSEIGATIQSFTANVFNSILNKLAEIILDFPTIMLNSLVVLFTFFFALRDREKLLNFVKSLSPFSKDLDTKLFESSKDITASVLYGQIVVGLAQGVVISIGFFIFNVPNALLLSIVATIAGILPIVGPMFVWIPVLVYLFLSGDTVGSVGVLIFGLVSSNIDNFLRPVFIAKRTKLHSAVVLVGMIGGLFLFGVIGLILGPLILAYLLIILEVYRSRKPGIPFSLLKND